ncbi:hypothetical protein CEXT_543851 [Caerostris extrusa]|uniref:Uncharacterized protein n=1 Tax=Caerostris extrusa TaxID=172846 RepID=A0AAV4Y2I0_CAEEX|nr:hypothetical protein CEXT_543851 [Caerostris extrusa]
MAIATSVVNESVEARSLQLYRNLQIRFEKVWPGVVVRGLDISLTAKFTVYVGKEIHSSSAERRDSSMKFVFVERALKWCDKERLRRCVHFSRWTMQNRDIKG